MKITYVFENGDKFTGEGECWPIIGHTVNVDLSAHAGAHIVKNVIYLMELEPKVKITGVNIEVVKTA